MEAKVIHTNGIAEALRQGASPEEFWTMVQPFLVSIHQPEVRREILQGLSGYVGRLVEDDDTSGLTKLLITMPDASADMSEDVLVVVLRELFVRSSKESLTQTYTAIKRLLPEQDQLMAVETLYLCDALSEFVQDGANKTMMKSLARLAKANAAFTRVVLDEQRRGPRPSEDAFERSRMHLEFLNEIDAVYPGVLDAITLAARVDYHVATHAIQTLKSKQSKKSPVTVSSDDRVEEEVDDDDMTLEDELRQIVYEARELPIGQRRTVLLDLANKYPESIWPFAELSGLMSRAKDNLEKAEQGLRNASRFEEPEYMEQYKGRYWEMRETKPYVRLLLNKARGLMNIRHLDAALDVLDKALEL